MFMHGGWDHILGNMLFLAIFGKNVEDAFGPLRYLVFYFAGGFAAMMTQTAMTLLFGTAADAQVPDLGASGAIAAVLGAYFVLYPNSRIRTLVLVFSSTSRRGSSSAAGSSTSSSRGTSASSPPRPTAAASRSSPTSAASSSARSSRCSSSTPAAWLRRAQRNVLRSRFPEPSRTSASRVAKATAAGSPSSRSPRGSPVADVAVGAPAECSNWQRRQAAWHRFGSDAQQGAVVRDVQPKGVVKWLRKTWWSFGSRSRARPTRR